MAILLLVITIFCGYKIICTKGNSRFNWFLGSTLLIYSDFILLNKPHVTSSFFLVLCYFASLIKHKEFVFKQIPLKKVWVVYLIGFAIISINAVQLTTFAKVWKPVALFINTYFILFLGYFSKSSFKGFDKTMSSIIILMCIYGFVTLVLKDDILRSLVTPDYLRQYYFGDRVRVASTCFHPIAYGFVCSVLFLLVFAYNKTPFRRCLLLCLLASVFLCGSRTALVSLIVIMAIYITFGLNKTKKIKVVASICTVVLFLVLFVPPVSNKLVDIVDSAMGKSSQQGSSMEMRQGQLDASLAIASQFPETGGGFDYIQESLGFGKDIDSSYWKEYGDLYGFESYLYKIIIERGIVGAIIEIVVLMGLILWILSKRLVNKQYCALAVAILVSFIVFSLMTGTLNTWLISMFFIGIYMRKLHDIERQKKLIYKTTYR